MIYEYFVVIIRQLYWNLVDIKIIGFAHFISLWDHTL